MPSVTTSASIVRYRSLFGNRSDIQTQSAWTKTKTWNRTPGYRALVASGSRLPDQPFAYRYITASGGSASFYGGNLTYSEGFYVFPGYLTVDSDLVSRVLLDLVDKAKGQQWNVPVFVAEGRKTAQMVYSRAVHLAMMVRELRRGRIDRFAAMFHDSVSRPSRRMKNRWKTDLGRDAVTAHADIWLEAQYGWVPFMLDVRNAVNALMDVIEEPANTVGTVRTRRRRSDVFVSPEELMYSWATQGVRTWCAARVYDSQQVRATWRFSPGVNDLPGRFGLLNPLEVVWELVPFSFVADWFFPIGDYLSALDAPFRFNHVGGTYGVRRERLSDWYKTRDQLAASTPTSGSATTTMLYVQRLPITSVPNVRLSTLRFDPKIGAARAVSGVALLAQQLSRLGKVR